MPEATLLTRADRLLAVADRTNSALSVAASLGGALYLAQISAREVGGPMELLLREALADAVKLADRLAELAKFAHEAAHPKD